MKRFWKSVSVAETPGGFAIHLDNRPVKTPAKATLEVPTRTLADLIAAEWDAQVDEIDPASMPQMKLAATALDRIIPQRDGVVAETAKYAETDLICYTAEAPAGLAERQAQHWQPLHAFVRRRYDVAFVETTGLMHAPQPEQTVAALRSAVAALDPFQLTGVADVTGIAGSLVIALALYEGEITAPQAYEASLVDEIYQAEEWGSDELAEERRANLLQDLNATETFLKSLA